MGLFARAEVVMVPFPYSDFSSEKIRPVLLVADVGRSDWIVCQITSNPYGDSDSVKLTQQDFVQGGLPHTSYLRPGKLSTIHESQMLRSLGALSGSVFETCRDAILATSVVDSVTVNQSQKKSLNRTSNHCHHRYASPTSASR